MAQNHKSLHPLIFLHGWGTDSNVWQRQTNYFEQHQPVLKPTIKKWAKQTVVELFNQTDLDDAVLIGWSLGAMMALEAFVEIRDRLAGLLIIGAAARYCRGKDHPTGIEPVSLRAMKQRLQRDATGTTKDFFRLFFTTKEKQARTDFDRLSSSWTSAEAGGDGLDYLMKKDLRPLLPLIDIPTMIVHGEQDRICPLEQAEYLNKAIKDSSLRVFGGCGHMPFYSHADTFNSMLEEFCRAC